MYKNLEKLHPKSTCFVTALMSVLVLFAVALKFAAIAAILYGLYWVGVELIKAYRG